jgi:biopolymer transport protein TolR
MADQEQPLSAAQRSRIRRLSQQAEPEPGDVAGELNVVPYLDIITNVMMFVLASVTVAFVASIDTTPPSIGGNKVRADVSSKALNLSAWITAGGVSLKKSDGNIATGCENLGSGVTVPCEGPAYDAQNVIAPNWTAAMTTLRGCAKKLKNARPEFKEETQVTIAASPGIEYRQVIDVMDALRTDGEEDLFPEVHFGVAK